MTEDLEVMVSVRHMLLVMVVIEVIPDIPDMVLVVTD